MSLSPDFWSNNDSLINELSLRYGTYRGVDRHSIIAWLQQFDNDDDAQIGLKLLYHVDFFDQNKVLSNFRSLYKIIQSRFEDSISNIKYCGFGDAGTSGPAVLREFRQAAGLDDDDYQEMFIYQSQISKLRSENEINICLIDDVIGTGNQALEALPKIFEIKPENVNLYLSPIIIPYDSIELLEKEFDLKIIPCQILTEEDRIFSEKNSTFTQEEKDILNQYCIRAGSMPDGYGHSQLTTIFYTKTPDNVISILRCRTSRWRGLFIRGLPPI